MTVFLCVNLIDPSEKLKSIEERKKKPKRAEPSMSVQDEIKNAIINRRRFMDGSSDGQAKKRAEAKLEAPALERPQTQALSNMESRISMMIPAPAADDNSGEDSEGDWAD